MPPTTSACCSAKSASRATRCSAGAASSSSPGEGSLSAYLASLRRLQELDLAVLAPGHGQYVYDPAAKLDAYIEHRLDRERMLLEALDGGARSEDELLDRAWPDAPSRLRFPAGLSLRAHIEKLAEEGRLPDGVDPGLLPKS